MAAGWRTTLAGRWFFRAFVTGDRPQIVSAPAALEQEHS
jgi:hypothetical protein